MKIKNIPHGRGFIFKFLVDEERNQVLFKLKQLEEALIGLQYEGKISSFSYIKRIDSIVRFLKGKFQEHSWLDEKVVFPFLLKHIPRLSPSLHFLEMESHDFRVLFGKFDRILIVLKGKKRVLIRSRMIEELCEKGVFLLCLVREHIQLEKDIVYQAIFHELKQYERNSLQKEIELFLTKCQTKEFKRRIEF